MPDDTLSLAPVARRAALGELTADVVHAANNALFAILAQVELLLADAEPAAPIVERLELVQATGLDLKATLRGLGARVQQDDAPGPTLRDERVRATVELLRRTGRRRRLVDRYPGEPLAVAAAGDDVQQMVVHVLLHASAAAGPDGTLAIEVAQEDGAGVLLARAEGGAAAPGEELGVRVARALAERHGGTLEAREPNALLLRLPRA